MFRKVILSAAAATMVLGTSAFAQDGNTTAPKAADIRTRNAPAVTLQDFTAKRLGALKGADANGDGVLSRDELANFIQKREAERRAKRMERSLDIDGDGKVTLDELEKHAAKRFALMDRNSDGQLSGEEISRNKNRAGMHSGHRFGPASGHDRMHNRMDGDHGHRVHKGSHDHKGDSKYNHKHDRTERHHGERMKSGSVPTDRT